MYQHLSTNLHPKTHMHTHIHVQNTHFNVEQCRSLIIEWMHELRRGEKVVQSQKYVHVIWLMD